MLYAIRRLCKPIYQARLRRQWRDHQLVRLNVGASGVAKEGWTSIEEYQLDITKDSDWENVLAGRHVDLVFAEHVFEHLEPEEIQRAFLNISKHLAPGGNLRMAVPDGFHPSRYVRDLVKPGGLDAGADDHRVLLTIEDLQKWEPTMDLRLEPIEYFTREGVFIKNEMTKERGIVRRSADNYQGRFTDSADEMQRMLDTTPEPLRQQFVSGGFSFTSLIADWVKPTGEAGAPKC